jgi:flavin-dependent dehydrogenase
LSARFAAQAILDADKSGREAILSYSEKMRRLKRLIEVNEEKRKAKFASNETLAASMAPFPMLKAGVKMMAANLANKVLPPEKVITLPL